MAWRQPRRAYLGVITHDRNVVIWRMSPKEARELADSIDEAASVHDLAHQDAQALRINADLAEEVWYGL
jgi:hypothetical protein